MFRAAMGLSSLGLVAALALLQPGGQQLRDERARDVRPERATLRERPLSNTEMRGVAGADLFSWICDARVCYSDVGGGAGPDILPWTCAPNCSGYFMIIERLYNPGYACRMIWDDQHECSNSLLNQWCWKERTSHVSCYPTPFPNVCITYYWNDWTPYQVTNSRDYCSY